MNQAENDDPSGVGVQISTLKLTIRNGGVNFSSILGLLILYSKNVLGW